MCVDVYNAFVKTFHSTNRAKHLYQSRPPACRVAWAGAALTAPVNGPSAIHVPPLHYLIGPGN